MNKKNNELINTLTEFSSEEIKYIWRKYQKIK